MFVLTPATPEMCWLFPVLLPFWLQGSYESRMLTNLSICWTDSRQEKSSDASEQISHPPTSMTAQQVLFQAFVLFPY